MAPTCIEEEIICFADLFFSKNPGFLAEEKSLERIRKSLAMYGDKKIKTLARWTDKFLEYYGHKNT
jgi:uncharacterized protein